jgi:hypothetical protein
MVMNSADLPVPRGVDGLVYDNIELGGLALSAGIVENVVEELVEVGLTQAKEFAVIVVAGSPRGEKEVGLAADILRIKGSAAECDERCASCGNPRIFNVIVKEMDEIQVDKGASPR